MSNKMESADVYLPPDLEAAIEDELGYGDSKSEWIRQACRERLERHRKQS